MPRRRSWSASSATPAASGGPPATRSAVRDHDFASEADGKAIPYGIYDLAANAGWVNVGTDHDTAAFAVESIRRWWNGRGRADYPGAGRLLVTADAGGSNGYRTRAWKARAGRARAGDRAGDHRLPLPARHPMPLLVMCELSFRGRSCGRMMRVCTRGRV